MLNDAPISRSAWELSTPKLKIPANPNVRLFKFVFITNSRVGDSFKRGRGQPASVRRKTARVRNLKYYVREMRRNFSRRRAALCTIKGKSSCRLRRGRIPGWGVYPKVILLPGPRA